jgi:hypothetical protein
VSIEDTGTGLMVVMVVHIVVVFGISLIQEAFSLLPVLHLYPTPHPL